MHLASGINSRIRLPFRNIWNKSLLAFSFDPEERLCVILNAHFYAMSETGFFAYIKKRFPQSRIVLDFSDKYEYFARTYKTFPSPEELLRLFDLVMTYNVHDVKKYGFTLKCPCFPKFKEYSDNFDIPESDLFFVGQNKGRLPLLIDLFEKCQNKGLRCDFHIVGVEESQMQYPKMIEYNRHMTYEEVICRVKHTKCVINLVQENGEGVTMRDYEALKYNKYLLTNNYSLKETGLYTDQQIIWIDNFDDRIECINTELPFMIDYASVYGENRLMEWLENEVF